MLLNGTGGLAYAGVQNNVGLFRFTGSPTPARLSAFGAGGASFSDTRVGWTAGGGGEWMFRRDFGLAFTAGC